MLLKLRYILQTEIKIFQRNIKKKNSYLQTSNVSAEKWSELAAATLALALVAHLII